MAGTKVESILLAGGQNEGIDNAVLPASQLRAVGNMRMRRGSRWGKRFGHEALSTASFNPGASIPRCIGGALESCFAVVDSSCYNYDRAAATFVPLPRKTSLLASSLAQQTSAISGWVPSTSFTPVPTYNRRLQAATPCDQLSALGYLWSVVQFTDPAFATDQMLRIAATDPSDQTLVFLRDIRATVAAGGGISYPKLVLMGTTLALAYLNVGDTTVRGRTLTTLGGGFSAEVGIFGGGTLSYDLYPYTATTCLFITSYGGNSVTVGTLSLALAPTTVNTFVEVNPVTSTSIVGSTTTPVYAGFGITASNLSRVKVYATGFAGAVVGTVNLSITSPSRPLLCPILAGGVRAVFAETVAGVSSAPTFEYASVSALAVLTVGAVQPAAYPIAVPFATSDGSIYIWAMTGVTDRSATLLRLADSITTGVASLPIELSVQDLTVSLTATDLLGLPRVASLASAQFTVLIPTAVSDQSGGIDLGHIFRSVQASHFTAPEPRRSLRAVYADSCSFVPNGALTRIDDYGPVESGFVHRPALGVLVPAVGGAMVASSDYYYTAVYRSLNSMGRYEVSAPCAPVRVTMGVGQQQVTIPYLPLCISGRPGNNAVTEIYRTLSNGQTFYLVKVQGPVATFGAMPTVVDGTSDAIVAQQKALYTQVGQTLPNAFPPASRFGCSGGQRLFLGGLVRPDIVQCSKLIFGDQSPSFADADAFRIVLPAACTGLAWMDVLVMFTAEGIYIASGDGPDDSGIGDFGTLTRMPYELGCIEPRSVIVADDGCFFQTSRGLYLLPRGFGTPIPAGDTVQNTLTSYPIITGTATLTKTEEQALHWTCSDAIGLGGARIVYDLAHKVWSVDTLDRAPCGTGQWLANEVALFKANLAVSNPLLATDGGFDDSGAAISVALTTGDLRPFGVLSEGALTKMQLLAELRSACTLTISKFTEWGGSSANRVFALAGGDYQVGQLTFTDVELGPTEAREAVKLQLQISESSTTEGLAFIALAIEHEQGEGLKRASPLSRVT